MKTGMIVLAIGIILAGCKSKERMIYPAAATVTTEPVNMSVQETLRDTLVIEEEPAVSKPESVSLIQGKEAMRYCVIVGSFIYEQNAVNLWKKLMSQGFFGSSVMQNSAGMYRVSALCDATHADAWDALIRIRSQYPGFRDAWLLETK